MMHFMGPADRPYIGIIAATEPFKTLMNDHIVYQEISGPVEHDTETDGLHPPDMIVGTKINQQETGHSEDEGKKIVFFKNARTDLVMIFVQDPEKTMHHIFMGTPGDAFHDDKSAEKDKNVKENIHDIIKLVS